MGETVDSFIKKNWLCIKYVPISHEEMSLSISINNIYKMIASCL